MTVILGISCSHDASAALLINGKLTHAIQLERLTRVKHDGRPFLSTRIAADYCLRASNMMPDDVDVFAFNIQNLIPQQVGLSYPLADSRFDLFDPLGERVVYVSHHLAHAFGAFFCSPIEDGAAMVIDGSGGNVIGDDDLILSGSELKAYIERPTPTPRPGYHAESTYRFSLTGYRLVDRYEARSFHPMCGSSSLGETYASVTQYVFGSWQDGGKLMGLAPYGEAARFGDSLLVRDESGRLQFTSAWKQRLDVVTTRMEPLRYADLAARVQTDLEEAIVQRAERATSLAGHAALAYSGGVALNSVANQRILESGHVDSLYVMPASHDAGVAIGVAAAAWYQITGKTKGREVTDDYLGCVRTDDEISSALKRRSEWLRVEHCDCARVAELLRRDAIVGLYDGGAEFGPRALGHRSILAAPFDRAMWLRLNERVKYREEFRPYAPIVLAEAAEQYFEMGPDPESPSMLRVVRVREEHRDRLGAVTHVDGTARVQTVHEDRSPLLYQILTSFGDLTGTPILINTSMNVRGQPIVETPDEAIDMLLSTGLDLLLFADRIASRHTLPAEGLLDRLIGLAPGVRLTCEYAGEGRSTFFTCASQGDRRVGGSNLCFTVFSATSETESLGERIRHLGLNDETGASLCEEVRELVGRHVLLVAGPKS